LLIFQAKTDWEGNFEIVKRNEEKEAEEEEEEDEKRDESKKDGKCVKRKSVHEY
jgi:Na+/citrate or Na+/malate symporter